MLRAVSSGERALLLLGAQGVGKNRLADRLLGMMGREREYIQLHRDSTLASLTVTPALQDGRIVWNDSPLLRAARYGRICLVDEADKAPLEVVALLKQLVEDQSILLGNSQRLARHSEGLEGLDNGSETIRIHPDFAVWVLANPAGFPFLGNDLFAQCGDVFRTFVVPNPDRMSELRILSSYAPDIALTTLSRLAAAFGELRSLHANGKLPYPYSLREAVATARHLQAFPETPVGVALCGVLAFDSFADSQMQRQLTAVFARHEIDVSNAWEGEGSDMADDTRWTVQFERADTMSIPKTDVGDPKHGKVDPSNTPHVGGNTWAGGTGGSDTAGLGGRGGPYRLDAGHTVHQVCRSDVSESPLAARTEGERVRELGSLPALLCAHCAATCVR
jgi:hypothetical protein|eukprot:SAG25_NODE_31_length_20541_cov_59.033069_12_plen_391_part_00